ncbi:MAG TPA: ATP-binding cassette domain-containing protein [Holophaga sp.]|nr:ATP-binding cassette domain-containing protein [Holophaga sp.]
MLIHAHFTKLRPGLPALQVLFETNLKKGHVHFLIGPPSSGKGTLLRILQGRERPDRGLLTADGQIWFKGDASGFMACQDRQVGAVLVDDVLSRRQTPRAVLSRALAHWPTRTRARRISGLLERAGLARHARSEILELSAAQQWILAFVLALAPRPRLVLLEAPWWFMPPGFEPELRAWVLEEGIPLLLSNDGLVPVTRQGDLAIRMMDGRVQDIHRLQPANLAQERAG